MNAQAPVVVWTPQVGPQEALINCPIEEIFFGGARGGGKTDAAVGLALIRGERWGTKHHAIFFRRELTQLDAVIQRAREIAEPLGWTYKDGVKTLVAPNGATIKFRHLEQDSDAEKYQGWSVQMVIIEEMGNFPDPKPLMKLKGILRSPHGVPCVFLGTGNPGGPGHSWVKRRYIDPAPLGWQVIRHTDKLGHTSERVYIPSRVEDNKILMQNDPRYIARLAQTGSEQLVRAWLEGDFNIVDGAFFNEWDNAKHVIKTGPIPDHWTTFRSGDWGSARPFAFHWMAVASEPWVSPCGKMIPKNAIVVFRELYGIKIDTETGDFLPNQGLKLYAEEVGRLLAEAERNTPTPAYGVLDPHAHASDGGPSHAERIYRGSGGKVMFRPADNKRVAGRGAMGGWDQFRGRLKGEDIGDGKLRPMVYFMDCCTHAIRTIPMLQHDADNIEDIDSEGEDHAADSVRYGLMSRPWTAPSPVLTRYDPDKAAEDSARITLDELWTIEDEDKERAGFAGRI